MNLKTRDDINYELDYYLKDFEEENSIKDKIIWWLFHRLHNTSDLLLKIAALLRKGL
jgi:hypothetical protein